MKKILIAFLTLLFGFHTYAQDSQGDDFWVMFPGNLGTATLPLYITSGVNTSGTVSIPGLSFTTNFNVTAGVITTVNLPTTASVTSIDVVTSQGIHIVANDDITVYGFSVVPYTTDAFLAFPTDAIGKDYTIMAYKNVNIVNATQFGIVAAESGTTTVTITPSVTTGSRTAGVPYNITLTQGQTYMLRNTGSSPNDLTSTTISADKKVAVFGGHQCSNIPSGSVYYCDYLVEQLPPNSAWGTEFATVPLFGRSGDTFRIMAQQAGTTVSINGTSVATLNAGEFYESVLTGYNKITGSNPILVGQYSNSGTYDNAVNADPFFLLVPPTDQFLTDYRVNCGTPNIAVNYINIIAKTTQTSTVMVDGSTVGPWTAIAGTAFSGIRVPVSAGQHSVNSTFPIGVFVYGFGIDDSYGYLGGQSFSPVATVNSMSLNIQQINAFQAQEICGQATVLDQNNNPVPGVLVQMSLSSGSANSGSAAFGITNASGQVNLCYHACYAGLDTVIASIAGILDTFYVNVAPSDLSVSPNTANGSIGLQTCVMATIVDGVNTPVPNALVNFEVKGANPVPLTAASTNGSGQAQFCYTPSVAGTDTIIATAACTDGDSDTTIVTVTGGGVPCPPMSLSFTPYNGAHFLPQLDPYTFYFGTTQWKRIRMSHTAGIGPYTYSWGKVGTGQLKGNLTSRSIYLYEPFGPTKVYATVHDAGNGCDYTDTISIGWDDQYFCGTITPRVYKLVVCENGVTKCVKWGVAKSLIKNGLATLGPCPVPKTNPNVSLGFTVYPNPNAGVFTVEHVGTEYGKAELMVFDMNGRMVFMKNVEVLSGPAYYDVDLSGLANGMYVVKLNGENDVYTDRIQIMK